MTTIAFAGAGHISTVHGLAVKAAGATVTHVASQRWERAVERAGHLGATPCPYTDLPAGAEVVLVCTPPARHAHDAMQAVQAGAAVIVEKPLASTLVDADRLVAAATAGGRIAYAENLAYAPIIERALGLRPSLGPLHHLEIRVQQPAPDWGTFLTEGWGGGVLFDVGPHPLAVALLMARPARPVSVTAALDGSPEHPVDEHAEVRLQFDSGLEAHLLVSWRSAGAPLWDLQAASATGVVRIELLPTVTLELNGEPRPLPAPRQDLPDPRLEAMGYAPQIEAFLRDFAAGREPMMNVAFGREILEIICAAYASAGAGGRPEPLPFTGNRATTPLALWRTRG